MSLAILFHSAIQQNTTDNLAPINPGRGGGGGGGGGVLPYMSYIGMCRCEGYGFQRVYSRIGYRNQRVLV